MWLNGFLSPTMLPNACSFAYDTSECPFSVSVVTECAFFRQWRDWMHFLLLIMWPNALSFDFNVTEFIFCRLRYDWMHFISLMMLLNALSFRLWFDWIYFLSTIMWLNALLSSIMWLKIRMHFLSPQMWQNVLSFVYDVTEWICVHPWCDWMYFRSSIM